MNPSQMSGGLSMQDQAMLDYLLEMGALEGDQQGIDRQRLTAKMLRGASPTPEGRQAGRVYTAANPLEHVASTLGQGLASYTEGQANTAADVLKKKRMGALGSMRDRWGLGGGNRGFTQGGGLSDMDLSTPGSY